MTSPGAGRDLVSGGMRGRRRDRPWARHWRWIAAGLVLLVILVSGCQVHTDIDVVTTPTGTGTVSVTVTIDKAAAEAIGDIQSDLQISDLTAAGWGVTGPLAGADGSTVIRATHAFASPSEASTLVAEIAGTGPASGRPFQLEVTEEKNFWSTSSRLVGRADLRCNLDCFGDSGLARELGVPTGLDPGSPASQRRNFTFGLSVTLPGTLQHTNAESVSGHQLAWTPRLGEDTVLSATTSDRNLTHVYGAVAVIGGAVLLVVIIVVTWLVRRRSRRRRAAEWARWG